MKCNFDQGQHVSGSHCCECLTAIEEAHGCPEAREIILDAAVMDLEDVIWSALDDLKESIAGLGRAKDEAESVMRRIENLLNGLRESQADTPGCSNE